MKVALLYQNVTNSTMINTMALYARHAIVPKLCLGRALQAYSPKEFGKVSHVGAVWFTLCKLP